jgi:hypothetical protein
MNNTFELNRFGLVFKKLLFERSLMLFGSLILVLLFTLLVYSLTNTINVNTFSRATNNLNDFHLRDFQMAQTESFSVGLILGGIYWVFVGFNYFSNKEEGYNYLLLPASYFEKWLSVVFLFGLFIVLFSLFFRILDIGYIQYLNNSLTDVANVEAKTQFFTHVKTFSFWRNVGKNLMYPYFIFFNITGLMAIGTLYFNKTAVIKTVFIAICLEVLFRQINYSVAKNLFQLDIRAPRFYWGNFIVENTYEFISFPHSTELIYAFTFSVILPIILWLIALIRLREKEL